MATCRVTANSLIIQSEPKLTGNVVAYLRRDDTVDGLSISLLDVLTSKAPREA
jgi:hypothetical protein